MAKKKSKKTLFLIIPALVILLAAAGLWAYYTYFALNPFLEKALREQFGDEFFEDFNDLPEFENETNAEDQLEDIIARYEPFFDNLEEVSNERLESLFQAALNEYEAEKRAGTFDRLQLTNKYIQAGRLLEQKVDQSFYSLLDLMESELIRKDLPTDVIGEIKETYEQTKTAKKQELFSRLREKLDR